MATRINTTDQVQATAKALTRQHVTVLKANSTAGIIELEHDHVIQYTSDNRWALRKGDTLIGIWARPMHVIVHARVAMSGIWDLNYHALPDHMKMVQALVFPEKANQKPNANLIPLKTILEDPNKAKLARRKLRKSKFNPAAGRWEFPESQIDEIRSLLGSLAQ